MTWFVPAPRCGLFVESARAGQSLEEMKASIKLKAYKGWGQYEAWLPLNIEGM